MYSFTGFKYADLILKKEKYIFGRFGLYMYFGAFGEKLNLLKDLGSKVKILSWSRGIIFQGFEINALFSGIKGTQTPWGLNITNITVFCTYDVAYSNK